jgi:Ca2+-binding EF-hand superfamily protein
MIHAITVTTTTLIIILMMSGCATAQQKPLGVIYEATDTDGNGLISEAEWHAAAQKRFELLDTNRDGNISKEEMEAGKATMKERFKTLRRSGQ